jgi:hypothetical protein
VGRTLDRKAGTTNAAATAANIIPHKISPLLPPSLRIQRCVTDTKPVLSSLGTSWSAAAALGALALSKSRNSCEARARKAESSVYGTSVASGAAPRAARKKKNSRNEPVNMARKKIVPEQTGSRGGSDARRHANLLRTQKGQVAPEAEIAAGEGGRLRFQPVNDPEPPLLRGTKGGVGHKLAPQGRFGRASVYFRRGEANGVAQVQPRTVEYPANVRLRLSALARLLRFEQAGKEVFQRPRKRNPETVGAEDHRIPVTSHAIARRPHAAN